MLTDDDPFVYYDVGGIRITNDGTAKTVTLPSYLQSFVCVAEGGACRLEINGNASATSTIYMPQGMMRAYPLRPSQTLSCYGAAGTFGNFRFLG